jgi:hypothetical protein
LLRNKDKQKNTNVTTEEERAFNVRVLTEEVELLESLKRLMDTKDGQVVIKWILRETNPFVDPFTNSGETAYALGGQSVGRRVVGKLNDAGCDLSLTDFISNIHTDKINNIRAEINKLNKKQEGKKK